MGKNNKFLTFYWWHINYCLFRLEYFRVLMSILFFILFVSMAKYISFMCFVLFKNSFMCQHWDVYKMFFFRFLVFISFVFVRLYTQFTVFCFFHFTFLTSFHFIIFLNFRFIWILSFCFLIFFSFSKHKSKIYLFTQKTKLKSKISFFCSTENQCFSLLLY